MPSIPSIDRTRAALLVMDYQVDIVVERVFPKQATVAKSEDVIRALAS